MKQQYVEVMGGYMSGGSKEDGSENSKSEGVFMMKKSVIVEQSELAGLMRRDWELCSMPVIKLRNTNRRPY